MKLMSPEYYSDICKLILKDNSILDDIYFYDLTSNSTNYRCRPYDSSFNQDQYTEFIDSLLHICCTFQKI